MYSPMYIKVKGQFKGKIVKSSISHNGQYWLLDDFIDNEWILDGWLGVPLKKAGRTLEELLSENCSKGIVLEGEEEMIVEDIVLTPVFPASKEEIENKRKEEEEERRKKIEILSDLFSYNQETKKWELDIRDYPGLSVWLMDAALDLFKKKHPERLATTIGYVNSAGGWAY